MEPNLIVFGDSRQLARPFYICTLLKLMDFNPHTDKCLVSTKDMTVKIQRGV